MKNSKRHSPYDQIRPTTRWDRTNPGDQNTFNNTCDHMKRLEDIEITSSEWVLFPFLKAGVLTGLVGPEGFGKSQGAISMGALTSRANLSHTIGSTGKNISADINGVTLHFSVEDSTSSVVAPRAHAAGADGAQYLVFYPGTYYKESIVQIANKFKNVRCVILDHWSFVFRGYGDTPSDRDRAISEICLFAEKMGCAVIILGHYSKSAIRTANPMDRVDFPKGLRIKLRGGLFVEEIESDLESSARQFALFSVKESNSAEFQGISYRIEPTSVEFDGVTVPTSKIAWQRLLQRSEVKELTNRSRLPATPKVSKLQQAKDFVLNYLADGPKLVHDLKVNAEKAGISPSTLQRARDEVEQKPQKLSGQGQFSGFVCALPHQNFEDYMPQTTDEQVTQPAQVIHLSTEDLTLSEPISPAKPDEIHD